jgi:putative component of membrane protein insertase Oxa1/YidC/SpoIIIJ protein YidD
MEEWEKRIMQYSSTLHKRSFRKNPEVGQDGAALKFSHTPFRQMRIGLIFLILFFSLATWVYASDFKGPWDINNSQKISQKQIDKKVNPLRALVESYSAYISQIDGKTCPMYPSCSKYSIQCFKKHSFFTGWMMTCDRLFRCGRDELRLSPQIIVNGKLKWYDPLENNDFWWYHEQ